VLFLDDLQWADAASLQLIEDLITDPDLRFVFLIGAYRDNELSKTHPLTRTVEDILKAGVNVQDISLPPLNVGHVNSIVVDLLRCRGDGSFALAELVHKKTNGNPFFINQFMEKLYEGDFLKLDPEIGWQWDIDEIGQMQVTENVVDLMEEKIRGLSEDTKEMLRVCSCIGHWFDLETLSAVLGRSVEETLTHLTTAISEGLINRSNGIYVFYHDRIREAAYNLIPEEERPYLHYRIGTLVLQKTDDQKLEDKIFYVVNQLNFGVELVAGWKEKVNLSRLNLMAGLKAKTSTAYEAAQQFLRQGIELLPPDAWKSEYELTLALYVESGEVGYLTGDHEQAERFFDVVLDKAKTTLDKLRIYEVKIPTYTGCHKYKEALQLGKEALRMLGVRLPRKANYLTITRELLVAKFYMTGKKIEDLVNLPELTDSHKLAIARILMSCVQPSYIADPALMPIITMKLLNLTLRYGNSSYASYAYAAYAGVLCGKPERIEQGYRFGKLALKVLEKFNATYLKCKVYFIFGNYVNHWKRHVRKGVEYFLEAYRSGPEAGGDLSYKAMAIIHYLMVSLWSGEPISEIIDNFERYYGSMKSLKQLRNIQAYELWYQFFLNLEGGTEDKLSVRGKLCDEAELLPKWITVKNRTALAYYTVGKQFLFYLYDSFEDAIEQARKVRKNLDSMACTIFVPEHYFYDSLALLAHYPLVSKKEQKRYLKQVKADQRKMKKWAVHAPQNFAHKYFLVEAERLGVQGRNESSKKLYDRAISLAKQNGYMYEEAMANELAAKFRLSMDMKKDAAVYMQEARHGYERWGAKVKVEDLEEQYPELLEKASPRKIVPSYVQLDYEAVVTSLQAISREIILDDLLKTLMRIVIENAGAERGFFISLMDDNLYIEAEASLTQDKVVVFKSVPIEKRNDLSLSIVNYVGQTMQDIVLDDASTDGDFTLDQYVLHNQPKSILCLPVIRQSKLVGLLYLENNVTTGAFTPDRIEVLQLLASQAAISFENARLYDSVLASERALKVSEEKYRTILESIEDGYYEVDISGHLTFYNDSLCRVLGYSKAELIGMNYQQYTDQETGEKVYQTFNRVYTTDKSEKGFDWELIRKHGAKSHVEASVSLMRDELGRRKGFRGIVRDVTERKEIEKELKIYRDHLEELIAERTTELLEANERLKQEIGARRRAEEELVTYRDQLEDLVEQRTAQLTAANEQLQREINDRKRAEKQAGLRQEQLFQASKMASLGTLVSGVAHEINNPISFVMLNGPILQKVWQGVGPILDEHWRVNGDFNIANMSYPELSKRIPLLLSGITEGTRRVKTIVHDLKEFARQSPPELTDMVDVNKVAKIAVGLVSNLIKKSTSHFSAVYESDIPLVQGNIQRIEQVIINVLVNACQSLTDNEQAVGVSTAYNRESDCVVMEVRDEGKGMSPEVLQRIKDPFFTTKRETGGTGLGLAISDRIITDHSGTMVFDSIEGNGTTVTISLPVSLGLKEASRSENG